MSLRGRLSLIGASAVLVAACSGGGTTPAPATQAPPTAAPPSAAPVTEPPMSEAPSEAASASPIPGGLLEKVLTAGKLVISTDADYAPQSVMTPAGVLEGFDIDVATEIAERLGVTVEFTTQDWAVITAGSWGGRWDMSVGSMTITAERQNTFDFTDPYYYTPAQMAASTASGITTLEGLAGKTVCVGESTTYFDWLEGRPLDFGTLSPTSTPPAGVVAVTQKTDADCPQLWGSGRHDFEGFLSSSTVVDEAIKAGLPMIKVGDPVYAEPLAAAIDKSGPPTTDFVPAVTAIIQEMHADGTLTALSEKWFGLDLTQAPTP